MGWKNVDATNIGSPPQIPHRRGGGRKNTQIYFVCFFGVSDGGPVGWGKTPARRVMPNDEIKDAEVRNPTTRDSHTGGEENLAHSRGREDEKPKKPMVQECNATQAGCHTGRGQCEHPPPAASMEKMRKGHSFVSSTKSTFKRLSSQYFLQEPLMPCKNLSAVSQLCSSSP